MCDWGVILVNEQGGVILQLGSQVVLQGKIGISWVCDPIKGNFLPCPQFLGIGSVYHDFKTTGKLLANGRDHFWTTGENL